MIEFKGHITALNNDFKTDKASITIECEKTHLTALSEFDGDISVKVAKWRNKRSLNANAYCWALCNEIANVLRSSKDEVYLNMLKSYGQSEIISVLSEIDISGFIKYYEEFGTGTVNNKEFTHYKVFKGSSEYDSREMAILLDGIVHEAEALGISTLTPKEIEEMKRRWGDEL